MEAMNGDMIEVWDSFMVDLNVHLDCLNASIKQAFDDSLGIACSIEANNTRLTLQTLAATLHHRKELALDAIDLARECFHQDIATFHTDAFSSIRTAFIGKLLEGTYHAANMEYGKSAYFRLRSQ